MFFLSTTTFLCDVLGRKNYEKCHIFHKRFQKLYFVIHPMITSKGFSFQIFSFCIILTNFLTRYLSFNYSCNEKRVKNSCLDKNSTLH